MVWSMSSTARDTRSATSGLLIIGMVPCRDIPVAYSRVWWDEEANGPLVYKQVCFLDPEFGGRGIGGALLEWNEARLREIAPDHHASEQLLEAWANDRNVAATALIRGAGYEQVTYMAEMVRPTVDDLPEHPLPEGLELRPVTEADMRTIWEADAEAFRDHWGTSSRPSSPTRGLEFPYNDPTLWKIAWDDGGVAGQVKSFIDTAQNEEFGRTRGAPRRSRPPAAGGVAESRRRSSSTRFVTAARGMTEVALCTRKIRTARTTSTRGSATRSSARGRRTASRRVRPLLYADPRRSAHQRRLPSSKAASPQPRGDLDEHRDFVFRPEQLLLRPIAGGRRGRAREKRMPPPMEQPTEGLRLFGNASQ
jgi:GNAT superfamily N-acetyltransferase